MRVSEALRATVALLCAGFFAAGCGESSGVVTLDGPLFAKKDCSAGSTHPGCKNDDGGDGGGDVLAGLSGAISTPGDHVMTAVKDTKRSLGMNSEAGSRGEMTFVFLHAAAAWDAGEEGGCRTEGQGDFDALAVLLTGSATTAGFEMSYDKTAEGSPSDGHGVVANIEGLYQIGLFSHAEPPPTGTAGTGSSESYEFTGEWVRVWDKNGSPRNQAKLFCPAGSDMVTVTVTR